MSVEKLQGIEKLFDNLDQFFKKQEKKRKQENFEESQTALRERQAARDYVNNRAAHVVAVAKKGSKGSYHQALKEMEREKRLKEIEDEKRNQEFSKACDKARQIDEKGFDNFWADKPSEGIPDGSEDYVTDNSNRFDWEYDLDKLDKMMIEDEETGEVYDPSDYVSREPTIDIDSLEAGTMSFGASTGLVNVSQYQRVRNGQLQTVRSYTRRNR